MGKSVVTAKLSTFKSKGNPRNPKKTPLLLEDEKNTITRDIGKELVTCQTL